MNVRDTLRLQGGFISVQTAEANAGDITLNAGTLLDIREGSATTTSVAGGEGNGGNIALQSQFAVLADTSRIIAQARQGSGGNIAIRITGEGAFFQSPASIVDASSEFGISGTVEIDAPETDISRGLTRLPTPAFDAGRVLLRPCAERSGAEVPRLWVRQYEVLPDLPSALRAPLPPAELTAGAITQDLQPATLTTTHRWLWPAAECPQGS